jgi:hypothetical protein
MLICPPPPDALDAEAFAEFVDAAPVDETVSEAGGLAEATHGRAAAPTTADPMPNATAKAPTRPMYVPEPMFVLPLKFPIDRLATSV